MSKKKKYTDKYTKNETKTIFCTSLPVLMTNAKKGKGGFRAIPFTLIDYMIDKGLSHKAMAIMSRILQDEPYEKITTNKVQRRMKAKSRSPILKALKSLEEVGLTKHADHVRTWDDPYDDIWLFTDTPNCFTDRLTDTIDNKESCPQESRQQESCYPEKATQNNNTIALTAQDQECQADGLLIKSAKLTRNQQSNPSEEGSSKTPKNGVFENSFSNNTEEQTSSRDSKNIGLDNQDNCTNNSNVITYNIGRLDVDIPLEITQKSAYIKLQQYQICYRNMVDCKSRKTTKEPNSRLDKDVFKEQVWPVIRDNPNEFFYVMDAFILYIKEAGVYIFKDKYHKDRVRERFIEEEFPSPFNIIAGMHYAGNLVSNKGYNKTAGKKLQRALEALHKGDFNRIAKDPLEKYISRGIKELQRIRNNFSPLPPVIPTKVKKDANK